MEEWLQPEALEKLRFDELQFRRLDGECCAEVPSSHQYTTHEQWLTEVVYFLVHQ